MTNVALRPDVPVEEASLFCAMRARLCCKGGLTECYAMMHPPFCFTKICACRLLDKPPSRGDRRRHTKLGLWQNCGPCAWKGHDTKSFDLWPPNTIQTTLAAFSNAEKETTTNTFAFTCSSLFNSQYYQWVSTASTRCRDSMSVSMNNVPRGVAHVLLTFLRHHWAV